LELLYLWSKSVKDQLATRVQKLKGTINSSNFFTWTAIYYIFKVNFIKTDVRRAQLILTMPFHNTIKNTKIKNMKQFGTNQVIAEIMQHKW
jgi:hypothetical protein